MEKKLTFKEKIDIILNIKELSKKDIEKSLDVDGTFYKAYNENREPRKELLAEFLRKFHVKTSWWKNPIGTTEAEIFEKNPTPAINSGDNKETAVRGHVYTDLIERNSDYKLVPTMLMMDYSIIPKRILDGHEKEIARQDNLIAKYEGYINRLEKENESLRSQLIPKNA
jgi:hypothetical protein